MGRAALVRVGCAVALSAGGLVYAAAPASAARTLQIVERLQVGGVGLAPGASGASTASCDAGEIAVGGGYVAVRIVDGSPDKSFTVAYSEAVPDGATNPTSWKVYGTNNDSVDVNFGARVMCASVTGATLEVVERLQVGGVALGPGASGASQAFCKAGEVTLGGGFVGVRTVDGAPDRAVTVGYSEAVPDGATSPASWSVYGTNNDTVNVNFGARVMCASVKGASLRVIERLQVGGIALAPGASGASTASCVSGEIATGGSYVAVRVVDGSLERAFTDGYSEAIPDGATNPTSWMTYGTNNDTVNANFGARVICARLAAPPHANSLWGWGYRDSLLGDGSTALMNRTTPEAISKSKVWTSIAAGYGHTLAIRDDGTLWAWGVNSYGELGDGTTTSRAVPVEVGTATNWLAVAAGGYHSVALRTDGSLWAWGANDSGEVGDGTNMNNRLKPVHIGTATDWVAITAGFNHTLGLRSDGTLWAWGSNSVGQCGFGPSTANQLTPKQVAATHFASIAAGDLHTLATDTSGILWAWGDNSDGQLGIGPSPTSENVPTKVSVLTVWGSVAANKYHSAALRLDGTLWGWGENSSDQVGLGYSSPTVETPTQVGTATDWADVALGAYHGVAVRADGTLWAWGANNYGQLGDGHAPTTASSPEQIGTRTNWIAVTADEFDSFALAH